MLAVGVCRPTLGLRPIAPGERPLQPKSSDMYHQVLVFFVKEDASQRGG